MSSSLFLQIIIVASHTKHQPCSIGIPKSYKAPAKRVLPTHPQLNPLSHRQIQHHSLWASQIPFHRQHKPQVLLLQCLSSCFLIHWALRSSGSVPSQSACYHRNTRICVDQEAEASAEDPIKDFTRANQHFCNYHVNFRRTGKCKCLAVAT